MKIHVLLALFAAFSLLPGSGQAETVTIQRDMGGDLGFYEVRLGVYESFGIKVRIDGVCASACTILTRLPAQQICVTERAEMHFHKSRAASPGVITAGDLEAENDRLLALYPDAIQAWINLRGGLTDKVLTMPPDVLANYIQPCLPDDGSRVAKGRVDQD